MKKATKEELDTLGRGLDAAVEGFAFDVRQLDTLIASNTRHASCRLSRLESQMDGLDKATDWPEFSISQMPFGGQWQWKFWDGNDNNETFPIAWGVEKTYAKARRALAFEMLMNSMGIPSQAEVTSK